MKRIVAPAVVLSALLLAGCSSLVESGTEVNSKIPEKIGEYQLITREMGSQTGFCDGPTAVERTYERAYQAEFLYLREGFSLPAVGGGCIDQIGIADTDGVLAVKVENLVLNGVQPGCEIMDYGHDMGITACTIYPDGKTVKVESKHVGPEEEFRAELQEFGETFIEKAQLKLPEEQ